MSNQTPDLKIEHRLKELKEVPPRNPLKAASGRSRFLSDAAKYGQAVSPGARLRQKGWILKIRKEKFAMNVLVSLLLAGAMILGGGATAVAAQDDLPNQPLYPIKLMTENARMAMTGDPQEQANLLMSMAQTRVEEMAGLVEQDIPVPSQVHERLREQIQQALTLAANMDDATRDQTLQQLRDCLQTQDHLMERLQTHASSETEPLLTQTRQMLQTHLQLVDDGLADPQGFQYMMDNQMRYGQDEEAVPEPNQQGDPGLHQNDQGGQPPVEPGDGNGQGNGSPGDQNPDSLQNGNGSGSGDNSGSGSGGNK